MEPIIKFSREAIMKFFFKDWTSYYRRRFFYAGEHLLVAGRIIVVGKVSVGDSVMLSGGVRLLGIENGTIKMGNHIYIGADATISSTSSVELGSDVVISPYVLIIDHDGYGLDGNSAVEKSVRIGNHVWIGIRAIILKGVAVGDNSIVGAGAVVTKDVEPNTIVAGNPARKIRNTTGYTITSRGPIYYPSPKYSSSG
jgi:acetyltransferase-like isoleucine patch superfamily enzyme